MVKANLKKVISYAIHEKYQQYVNLIYKLTRTYLYLKKKKEPVPTHTYDIHPKNGLHGLLNRKYYWRCVCVEIGCALCCSVSFITCLLLFL